MKKYLIYSLIALAGLALSSCDDEDFDNWSSAQANDQESSSSAYGVTLTAGPAASISMSSLEDDSVKLVAVPTSSDENISSYSLVSLTVGGVDVEGTIEDGYIVASANDIAKIVESIYLSRAATTRTVELTASVSVNLANGDAVTAGNITYNLSFVDYAVPEVSADGYKMLGTWQNWDITDPVTMEAQSDGTYTATVTLSSDADYFKIYRGDTYTYTDSDDWSSINTGAIGCIENGDTTSTGNIAVYEGDPLYDSVQSPAFPGSANSIYLVTFDPANMTYKMEYQGMAAWSAHGDWDGTGNWETKTMSAISSSYDLGFMITLTTTAAYAQFGFNDLDGNWNSAVKSLANYNDGGGYEVTVGTGYEICAYTTETPNVNCYIPEAGDYDIYVLTSQSLAYVMATGELPGVVANSYGICGTPNGWGTIGDFAMTAYSGDWVARTGVTLVSGDEIKIRYNNDWSAPNFGSATFTLGTALTLTQGGDNISVTADGTYDIYFNTTSYTLYIVTTGTTPTLE